MNQKECHIDGCVDSVKACGLCGKHYERNRRNGHPIHRPLIVRNCASLTCGRRFETAEPRQIFCGSQCRHRTQTAKQVDRWAGADERHCPRCDKDLPGSAFGKHKSYCLACYSTWRRERIGRETADEREERLARRRKAKADRPIEQRRADYRKARKRRMNLSMEEEVRMLASQGGGCAICGRTEPGGRGTWHIDHDHDCCPKSKSCGQCIRGLLCSRCNVGGGQFDDDPRLLRAAADYFERGRQPALVAA